MKKVIAVVIFAAVLAAGFFGLMVPRGGGLLGKERERQIIPKTDERNILVETAARGNSP
jgi:hypothetical protein